MADSSGFVPRHGGLRPPAATGRRLTTADIAAAMRLKDSAGWNQTEQDWLLLLELDAAGCFAVEVDGELGSTATVAGYGQELAWIGMVLTAPHLRRRGCARLAVTQAVDYAMQLGAARIGLDATDMAVPLYGSLGFGQRGQVERWMRAEDAALMERFALGGWTHDPALDRAAFGAGRERLLRLLSHGEAASLSNGSYAMGRPGTSAAYFGPCVARSASDARQLLCWFLSRHPGEAVYWDLLAENEAAVRLAKEYGFAPVRRLARMMREVRTTQAPPPDPALAFAVAGLELG